MDTERVFPHHIRLKRLFPVKYEVEVWMGWVQMPCLGEKQSIMALILQDTSHYQSIIMIYKSEIQSSLR